jgi:hypothetical protein
MKKKDAFNTNDGEEQDFIDFESYSKGPLKRLRNFFLGSSTN